MIRAYTVKWAWVNTEELDAIHYIQFWKLPRTLNIMISARSDRRQLGSWQNMKLEGKIQITASYSRQTECFSY